MTQHRVTDTYRVRHVAHEWADVIMLIARVVISKAADGDTGSQNNICIAFRKQVLKETGRRMEPVEYQELVLTKLRA